MVDEIYKVELSNLVFGDYVRIKLEVEKIVLVKYGLWLKNGIFNYMVYVVFFEKNNIYFNVLIFLYIIVKWLFVIILLFRVKSIVKELL